MESNWKHLKPEALKMRRQGLSIRAVENILGIPRSTLSGWYRQIKLSIPQQKQLHKEWRAALTKAREKAVLWHNTQKAERLGIAVAHATSTLRKLNTEQKEIIELTLAMLYWGEGNKTERGLVLGNSNPEILKFFMSGLKMVYGINPEKMRYELHIRSDQNPGQTINYWSRILDVSKNRFKGVYIDQRTIGKKTYASYYGVCVVSLYNVAIQRKLMYLYQLYCQKIIQQSRA